MASSIFRKVHSVSRLEGPQSGSRRTPRSSRMRTGMRLLVSVPIAASTMPISHYLYGASDLAMAVVALASLLVMMEIVRGLTVNEGF